MAISSVPAQAPFAILFSMGMPKSIGTILIDAFTKEDHHSSNIVTDYPVEDGSPINDNVIGQPDDLTIEGICGPSSILNPVATLSSIVAGGGSLSSFISRPLDVDQALYKIKSDRLPVTVVTGLRVYQNMIVLDYRVPRDKGTGGALVFTIQLKSVVIVQSQQVNIPNIGGSQDVQRQAPDTSNYGNGSGEKADPNGMAAYLANQEIAGWSAVNPGVTQPNPFNPP